MIIEEPIKPFSLQMKGEIINYENTIWFKEMESFRQKLFIKYHSSLIKDKVIHNKLNYIPGVKNAFTRTDILLNMNNNEIINQNIIVHTAALSTIGVKKNKEEGIRLSEENIIHLNKTLGDINISCLINTNKLGEEGIYQQEKQAIVNANKKNSGSKTIFNALSINFARKTPKAVHLDNIKNLIKQNIDFVISHNKDLKSSPELKNSFIALQKFAHNVFTNKSYMKNFQTKLSSDHPPELKNFYHDTAELIKSIGKLKNINLLTKIVDIIKSLLGAAFKLNLRNKEMIIHMKINELFNTIDDIKTVVHCKSGKDRTALVVELTTNNNLASNVTSDKKKQSILMEELLKNSLESGHTKYLNGSLHGGNSLGCFGVLTGVNRYCDKDHKKLFNENLIANTASGNKINNKNLTNKDKSLFKKQDSFVAKEIDRSNNNTDIMNVFD